MKSNGNIVKGFDCHVVGCGKGFDSPECLAQHREEEHHGQEDGVQYERVHKKEGSDMLTKAPHVSQQQLCENYFISRANFPKSKTDASTQPRKPQQQILVTQNHCQYQKA